MDISSVLNDARSQIKLQRKNAEEILNQLAENDFAQFLLTLAQEINNEDKIKENRQLAASIFKNSLTFNEKLKDKWINMNSELTIEIKNLILTSLASKTKEVRRASSLVIMGICKIDLPRGKWNEIIKILIEASMNSDLNTCLSGLETIGLICEEIKLKKGINQEEVNEILNVLVKIVSRDIIDFQVGQYVLNTLLQTISHAEKNIKNKNESAIIFNLIFILINLFKSHPHIENLINLTLQIFIEIISTYYDYIDETIFFKIAEFSMQVFSTFSVEKLIILNFELWLTISEYELDISDSKEYKGYTEKLLPELLKYTNLFLNKSDIEEEDDDDDEINSDWTVAEASLSLLIILVQFASRDIIDNIMNYVKQNLGSNDWKQKKQGLLVIGCLLESNFKEEIKSVIKSSIEGLLNLLFDGNYSVRKTCSWVLVRLTELYPRIFDKKLLDTFIPVLINALRDKNGVSNNICVAVNNLCKELGDKDTVRNSNSMSPYFESLFKEIYSVAYKEGSYDKDINVSTSAFLSLSNLIQNSSLDKQDKLEEIMVFLVNSLENTITYDNKDKEKAFDFQCLIISVITSILEKSLKSFKLEIVLKYYNALESCFKLRNGIFDTAISSISSVAKNQNEGFVVLIDRFLPYLRHSLSRYNEKLLLHFGVIATGDIAKALKKKFEKYVYTLVSDLFIILQENSVCKNTKVITIDILGDIILSLPESLPPFVKDLMNILFSACQSSLKIEENEDNEEDDEEEVNYYESLRNSLVEAFTSIAFAMKDIQKEKEFAEYVPSIFEYIGKLSKEEYDAPNNLLKSIIGFVADLCITYGKEIRVLIQGNPFIYEAMKKLKSSKSKKNIEFLNWAEEVITIVNS